MKKIKTREQVKNIKLLDKSAIVGERMKTAFIRSKENAARLMDDEQATPSEYAGDKVQYAAEDISREMVSASVTGTKAAVSRGREAFRRQKLRKEKIKTREAEAQGTQTAAGHMTEQNINLQYPNQVKPAAEIQQNGLRRQSGAANKSVRPIARSIEFVKSPGVSYCDPAIDRSLNKSSSSVYDAKTATERGRELAKTQAVKQAEKTIRHRRQEQISTSPPKPQIKTRDALTHSPQVPPNVKSTESERPAIKAPEKAVKAPEKAIKPSQRSIKTGQQTSKVSVKTAAAQEAARTQNTAKAASKAAKAAQKAEHAARAAMKASVRAAKAAAKATVKTVKAIIQGTKALISAIVGGGWIAALIIVVICLIGLITGSCFGIFFSGEDSGTGQTMPMAVRELNQEYEDKLEQIKADNPHDELDMSGSRAVWPEVLAVYAVKTTTDPDNPHEVATMDDDKKELLREIFWAMNVISYTTYETEAADGSTEGEKVVVLKISVSHKTAEEMAEEYGFSDEQKQMLSELLSEENRSLWSQVLYGIGVGDGEIITVALSQVGNVGGGPYWSWYGYPSRVAWCACFVSWCANECGYIDAGIIPKFSYCPFGAQWFKDHGQWQDNSYEPRSGDIIFIDWEMDGLIDHVGLVEKCEGGIVYTVEGNRHNSCITDQYYVGRGPIAGYGCPAY